MNSDQLTIAKRLVFNQITFISNDAISPEYWKIAFELVKNIDEKDTPFVATALSIDATLWTGDLKLITGLRKKGFNEILNTQELLAIRK